MMRLLILSVLSLSLVAVEVAEGDTAWLERTFRPDWALETVQGGLDRLAKESGVEIERSPGIRGVERDLMLTIIASERVPLRQVLTWIEATVDVRFRAGPQVLQVETGHEERDRRRRHVALSVTDYAQLLPLRDFVGRRLGFFSSYSGSGSFSLFAGGEVEEGVAIDPEDLRDALSTYLTNQEGGVQTGRDAAYLFVTEEEERAVRSYLDEGFRRETAGFQWRATFGVLKEGAWRGGPVPAAEATALGKRLTVAKVLVCESRQNQRVTCGNLRLKSRVTDTDTVNDALDPIIEVLGTGRGVDLRAVRGHPAIALSYHLAWVDPVATRVSHLRVQDRQSNAGTSVNIKTDKEATVDLEPVSGQPGHQIDVDLDQVWTWQPRGATRLQPGEALVLGAPHAEGTALIILEILP